MPRNGSKTTSLSTTRKPAAPRSASRGKCRSCFCVVAKGPEAPDFMSCESHGQRKMGLLRLGCHGGGSSRGGTISFEGPDKAAIAAFCHAQTQAALEVDAGRLYSERHHPSGNWSFVAFREVPQELHSPRLQERRRLAQMKRHRGCAAQSSTAPTSARSAECPETRSTIA